MSIKKTVAIVAAAGALAAISVPAMAFENEFHGLFNAKFYLTNYEKAANGFIAPTTDNLRTGNYFEQRARLQYIAKASNDLKLVTQFEIDSTFGGNGGTGYKGITTGNTAGQLDADSITLETKHVYLDFNAGPSNVKVGILPYKDAFKGIFLDADVSAIATSTKLGDLTVGAAFTRVATDKLTGTVVNDLARDLFLLDTSYALNKDTKVGFSYYIDADYTTATKASTLHVLGLNADAKVGALNVSGFAAMQLGNKKNAAAASTQYHGYALNAAAKMAVGPGTAKTAFLYTSGDDANGNHNNAWQTPLSTYSESGMMLLNRNTADDGLSTDYALAFTTNNNQRGNVLYTIGYDAKLGAKAYANFNAGMLWVAKSAGAPVDAKTKNPNSCDLMATEINVETGYKVYDNLTAKFQAAYAILGGYYNGSSASSTATVAKDPENPYTVRLGLSYTF